MSETSDLVEVGRVLATHGVRGWLKVAAATGPESVLHAVPSLWLVRHREPPVAFEILQRREHSGNFLLALQGLDDPETAAAWRGSTVCVPRSSFPDLPDDEVYWIDMIGCTVVTSAGHELGTVAGVDDHGGGPFLRVVSRADRPGVAERLIPFVPVYVLDVDLVHRIITVDWQPDWD